MTLPTRHNGNPAGSAQAEMRIELLYWNQSFPNGATMSAHTSPAPAVRRRGRPRSFDMDQALDKAARVFCERGYHGTSISDLTEAMQLTQGSLYKAFKDKQAIFLAAFDRYRARRLASLREAMGEGSGMDRLRNVLAFHVESAQGTPGRTGCLVVGSVAEIASFDPPVAQHVLSALARNEAFLADLIQQGQKDGSIAATLDRKATARMLLCLTQGMRVVGKTGATRASMRAVVQTALRALA